MCNEHVSTSRATSLLPVPRLSQGRRAQRALTQVRVGLHSCPADWSTAALARSLPGLGGQEIWAGSGPDGAVSGRRTGVLGVPGRVGDSRRPAPPEPLARATAAHAAARAPATHPTAIPASFPASPTPPRTRLPPPSSALSYPPYPHPPSPPITTLTSPTPTTISGAMSAYRSTQYVHRSWRFFLSKFLAVQATRLL